MSKQCIAFLVAAVAVIVFVAGKPAPPGAAPDARVLTPEYARAALVELHREQPYACGVKIDPDEYAAKPLEERGKGRYRLGWFSIDVTRPSFQLALIGKGHVMDCKGV